MYVYHEGPEPDGVVAQLAGQANGWLSRGGRMHLDFSSCRSAEPRPAHRDAKGALARVHRDPGEVGNTFIERGKHRVVTRV